MKLSILDLVTLREGQTYAEAYQDTFALAQLAEKLGYQRFWLSEHHNSRSIGSSATQILISQVLGKTKQIRVGSGGVMLPNHSPYLVAEQYGTIESLFPGRLDLGLGRAPGTDMKTARALRRSDDLNPHFEEDLAELERYFQGTAPVHAYPAEGLTIPKYILGSSTDSAYLAAKLGLPYAFAGHFAPAMLEEAVQIYRRYFKSSSTLDQPYVIVGLNAVLADSDEEAQRLKTSLTQVFLGLVSGEQRGILPPKAHDEAVWEDFIASKKVPHFGPIAFEEEQFIHREKTIVQQMTNLTLVGSPETVRGQIEDLLQRVELDELMAVSYIYDQKAQWHSYKLLAEVVAQNFQKNKVSNEEG